MKAKTSAKKAKKVKKGAKAAGMESRVAKIMGKLQTSRAFAMALSGTPAPITAPKKREPTGVMNTVNKRFLLNTVQSLQSHNKREEEEDCWRQKQLVDQVENTVRLEQSQSQVRGRGAATATATATAATKKGVKRKEAGAAGAETVTKSLGTLLKEKSQKSNAEGTETVTKSLGTLLREKSGENKGTTAKKSKKKSAVEAKSAVKKKKSKKDDNKLFCEALTSMGQSSKSGLGARCRSQRERTGEKAD